MRSLLFMGATLLLCGSVIGDVTRKDLGEHNGSSVYLYTLTNQAGNVLQVTGYGARIVHIMVPDRDGKKENVTTGGDTLASIVRGDPYGGATIGRFANRIAEGEFRLDGEDYELPVNNRPNTLHGGPNGWHTKVWDSEVLDDAGSSAVKFSYISPDMEEGFPGRVNVSVTYTWTDENEIIIEYEATTDKTTVINLTNHAYFNLHGVGNGYIFDHILTLNASQYTPLDSTKIPTGKISRVKGTPYDFTEPQPMGYQIGEKFKGSVFQGYDDNYVLDGEEEVAAVVYDPVSGRVMEVITDQPGLQFYSGSGGMQWKQALERGDVPGNVRSAFALETQHYPDSPNQSKFPTTTLNPDEVFKSRTIYRFSVRKDQDG